MDLGDDDALAVGEAFVGALRGYLADPVEQRAALDGVWECHARLVEQDRHMDALRLLDELLAAQLQEPDQATDESAREIAQTMLERAWGLWYLDRFAEAEAQCGDLLNRFDKGDEGAWPWLQKYVAEALFCKGDSLLELGRWLEALDAFDELMARERALPVEAERAEEIMSRRAAVLAELGRVEEATAAYDALFAIPDPADAREVALAYGQKTSMLADRRDFEAAILAADAAMQRFGSSKVTLIRWVVAGCLDIKINCLRALGRRDAAAHAADQLVDRFGADLDSRIEEIVAPHAYRLGRRRSRLRVRGIR